MKSIKIISLLFLGLLFFNFTPKQNNKPTVFMVGDSTVKNGKGDGLGGLWGWGDYIGQFLDTTKVNVENHALGGTSSRTFQDKGLWNAVLGKLKKGDYVLIQFGHNDDGPLNDSLRARGTIKGIGNETEEIDNILTKKHETVHSYGWYIQKVVREAKSKGAIPIICSPIPRNDWKEKKVPRNDKSYGLWAKQIAEKEKVTFINLNEKMVAAMEKLGEAKVTGTYFYKKDHTHTSAKGAVLSASVIVKELKESKNTLKNYILEQPKIELPAKKKVFLIGDSTMADNNNPDAVGWGVCFAKYCDTTRIEVINKARGGRSTRTFVYEGLWDEVKNQLKPGDFILIQFGHNDAGAVDKEKMRGSLKGNGDETQEVIRPDGSKEIVRTFGWYMEKFIREAKEKGAIPIVLSLTPRNEWPNDKAERRTDTYVNWSKIAAEKEKVPFIDLNDITALKYEALGKEKVKTFFPKDHTHTGLEGADLNALTAAENIKKIKEYALKDYIEIPK
ncbi:rhamnogalacturonan acetylesterase [Flavobacterium reichenbachii]|uniref:Rhamnogalacturonan acetylesterase n=1 Tax=Flavobacterium reichenbachii TaxID=362418 RepID=A0A085ZEZ1_9FLAO|nr:rhamnogalacturonan acetylesterase [Flavobacterium reichenbachii]KFF03005.1 rhamnogalacturonan acetylesterase [Flavobacterium reichenbachii]OXB10079.1 rhamnogalacturonan acetylesterase [Flavobacterium reichenbachii]